MATHRLSLDARQAQIVRASMALFAKKGFSGTTSRELARAAGVSEALIFRLFPTKRALYSAIIQQKIAESDRFRDPVADRDVADRDYFLQLTETLLTRIRNDSTFMRLMLFSALEGHALSDMYYDAHVSRLIDRLRQRIQTGVRAGRYRPVDPYLSVRAFLGMVIHFAISQGLYGRTWKKKISIRRAARTFVDVFFSGVEKRFV